MATPVPFFACFPIAKRAGRYISRVEDIPSGLIALFVNIKPLDLSVIHNSAGAESLFRHGGVKVGQWVRMSVGGRLVDGWLILGGVKV
jgi:hypothetical protein